MGTYKFISSTEATRSLGNDIENSRRVTATASFSLMNLYNKVPFVKKAYENQKSNNSFGLPNRPNKRSLSRNPQDTVKTEQDSVPALQKFLKEALNYSIRFVTAVKTVSISLVPLKGALTMQSEFSCFRNSASEETSLIS